MKNTLSEIELRLLDKFLHTTLLNEAKSIQIALRNFLADEKDNIMQELSLTERDIRTFQTHTAANIFEFLKSNDFVAEREGGVIFITEKGKHLRRQGSVAKFEEWQKETRAKNKKVIHTIETRGYLDQDEIVRNRRALIMKRIKKFVLYPILLLILCFFLLLGAHHYNLDKNVPFIRKFFKDEKVEANKDDAEKDGGVGTGNGHGKKKKGHKGN